MSDPQIIQGGMGVGVSSWRLARAVSTLGQLGVVAGTALDVLLARRLQDGDPKGDVRRALAAFPFRRIAETIEDRYFISGGKPADQPYRPVPMQSRNSPRELVELWIAGSFTEVWLAREGHDGVVGINFLEKIQPPHLASLYGAMLAGVDYVLMGAGIPLKIPGVLDLLATHQAATYNLTVTGAKETDDTLLRFDPKDHAEGELAPLSRPRFLPIVSSSTLALTLLRRANGRVDGFIVEAPTAGGHNAPPRGKLQLSSAGEPVYGERDVVDFAKMRELGVPFWLAGGRGTAEGLSDALANGAAGIQVGTPFAFCEESDLDSALKASVLSGVAAGSICVFTDPVASPTGFPFKVASLDGSLSSPEIYTDRERVCDLGFLREPFRKDDATLGYRCPSEPVEIFASKGGETIDTGGRKCLCNGLLAAIGQPQVRADGRVEKPLVTSGDDVVNVRRYLRPDESRYSARDVVEAILAI
jgi:nitronate monooxygenase